MNLIPIIQKQLSQVSELNYIDENWGQLDYYSPNFPVKWPCALIDVSNASFSNIGIDKQAKPQNRQMGDINITINIANVKLTNTSLNAPQRQKDDAWSIWGVIEKVHEILHGFSPNVMTSKLIRVSMQRSKRDDGVQEYVINYNCSITDI